LQYVELEYLSFFSFIQICLNEVGETLNNNLSQDIAQKENTKNNY
jgi:hypothetical protein